MKTLNILMIICVFAVSLPLFGQSNYKISKYVISSGGTKASNPDQGYYLRGTLGQPLIGEMKKNDMINGAGYWYGIQAASPTAGLILNVENQEAPPNDTVKVDVFADMMDSTQQYKSFEINLTGFLDSLNFIEIDTTNSIIPTGWLMAVNQTDTSINTAFAGTTEMSGDGKLFSIVIEIPPGINNTSFPVDISYAIFDAGLLPYRINNGNLSIEDVTYGDVDGNGEVQAYDAALVLSYLLGNDYFTALQLASADVSLNSEVSTLDASLILQYVVGNLSSLPYDSSASLIAQGNIAMQDKSYAPNNAISIPIMLINSEKIFSFSGMLDYDQSALEFQKLEFPKEVNGFIYDSKNKSGSIEFVSAGENVFHSDSLLLKAVFVPKNNLTDSTSTVYLSYLRWNENKPKINIDSTVISIITDVKESLPKQYNLSQNYPNPFNPSTKIKYALPKTSNVKLKVYDILGREVRTLVDKKQIAGRYEVVLNANNLASGAYIYRITASDFIKVKKMILLK